MVALSAALALLLALTASAATASHGQSWPIDAKQSQVQFMVREFWFARIRGTFPELSGNVRRIDTASGADLVEVSATLEVDKLRMDEPRQRERALADTFFDAARYPTIRFDSDPFPLTALRDGGELHGMLDLHGERQPVQLELDPSDCPRQPLDCVIRLHGKVARTHFGMRAWRGVLSDKVELDLRIRLARTAADG